MTPTRTHARPPVLPLAVILALTGPQPHPDHAPTLTRTPVGRYAWQCSCGTVALSTDTAPGLPFADAYRHAARPAPGRGAIPTRTRRPRAHPACDQCPNTPAAYAYLPALDDPAARARFACLAHAVDSEVIA